MECTLVHIIRGEEPGFEWDDQKARTNERKHGVDFADATAVLEDERGVTIRYRDALKIPRPPPMTRPSPKAMVGFGYV